MWYIAQTVRVFSRTKNKMTKISALLVSDFNGESFTGYLNNDTRAPQIACQMAPFGQVVQSLADETLPCWRETPDLVLVWTTPERQLPSFRAAIDNPLCQPELLMAEVDEFCRLIQQAAGRVRTIFVTSWVMSSANRGLGLIDLKQNSGCAHMLLRANLRLVENLKGLTNVYVLNAQRWLELAGAARAYDSTLWYMGKVGFGLDVQKQAVHDVKAALQALTGMTRKLIVLDLDDTLWGGIIGDVGLEGLRLGGHDPVGEALVDLQRYLKALKNRGILLGIVSKNEENLALQAISQHPEMVLRVEDFAGWRINWKDKADNLLDLVKELNVGLQSVVFIDDNPAERFRIQKAFPEVLVPEWPKDKLRYPAALQALDCFDLPAITPEDAARSDHFLAERLRKAVQTESASVSDWLQGLDTTVTVEPLSLAHLPRATQLLNKTNQMNLSTRRMTESEFWAWSQNNDNRVWTFRVSDRFGDAGLIGIVGLQQNGTTATMVDFVLSCRVMGRRIEETMVHVAAHKAKQLGLNCLCATYRPTPRNQPCVEFLEKRSAFRRQNADEPYSLSLDNPPPLPDCIKLIDGSK